MHVWVLNTFTRQDAYCDYDSEVVAVYSKSKFKEARKYFSILCKGYEGYDIKRWHDENGYHFSATFEDYKGCEFNYVGLKRMELI